MKFSGAALFPLVIMALLAGLTLWLERASQQDDLAGRSKLRHDPDFYAEHFTLRRFDATGAIQHTLTAEKMFHFPDDDSTEVLAPHLTYYGLRQTTVTARTAWLDKAGKHVRLNDDVRVVRAGDAETPETVITTSIMHVTPDDEYAYTDAPVTITQGQSVMHGVGLEANHKTQIAVLSGPVRGTIYRNPLHER
jgi:lipopolysaccharide export system protein LptC